MSFDTLANDTSLQTTIAALKANGIESQTVNTGAEAKEWILKTIPEQAEVMTMSSVTLETIGVVEAINESGKYDSVKKKLMSMDRNTQTGEMQKLGAAPEWSIGSVHAITEDGKVLIASNTGSQLPGYAYGSQHVIWVVGTQKIVPHLDQAMKRLEEYIFPLEDEHMQQLYKMGSSINKLLIFNKEGTPGRITVLFVKEKLGF
ncbi:MAG: LUD domain-containing protein [Patescibacteria group bacterium]